MRIVFAGGGTAGHVNPNLALIDVLRKKGWEIYYLGGKHSVEERMVKARDIPFYPIRSGKLRRYFSWKNFLDPFNLLAGIIQAYRKIRILKPNVVFSKGGFAALPVVIGAWLNRIPVVAHESDLTPGLANRLSLPFITLLCVTFPGSQEYLSRAKKIVVTGTPLRAELFHGVKEKGLAYCGFTSEKPCLLVMGGSQGAEAINRCIRDALPELTARFQVIHLCGQGRVVEPAHRPGYFQLAYAEEELADLIAASDYIVSRAGANALYEILACNKPHILIPLPRYASRGDQIHNARYFEEQGISLVIQEEKLTSSLLLATLQQLHDKKTDVMHKISALNICSSTDLIVNLIEKNARSFK
jgi:UDP-N-acetylglucosamine--N-acetylmuramyl-(pentapeptide) pyrophosphoryl-undecaprenol N-acetylglucosamine transferase